MGRERTCLHDETPGCVLAPASTPTTAPLLRVVGEVLALRPGQDARDEADWQGLIESQGDKPFRERMLHVAALAIAAVRSHDLGALHAALSDEPDPEVTPLASNTQPAAKS